MSENWEWIDGYDNTTYTDPMIFGVDQKTKLLQVIKDQPLVAGEDRSQMIRFEMDRYWDGVDITPKSIQVIYMAPNGYSDINAVVSAEKSDDKIRFGWVVPGEALPEPGKLAFSIEIVAEDYILKTRTTSIEIYAGLNGAEIIPEPVEKAWYIELQERCDFVLTKATESAASAETAAARADTSAGAAAASETGAGQIKTATEQIRDSIQASLTQIDLNRTNIAAQTARVDQMISGYEGSAEGEIADARIGGDGTTYGSLGAAIRSLYMGIYRDADGDLCQT